MISIMQKSKNFLKKVAIFALWVLIWQLASLIIKQEILLPSPIQTLEALTTLSRTGDFYLSVLLSLLRIISGYALGIIVGVIGAVLSYRFMWFKAFFSPILKIIKAVPVASFIILALVWFKSSTLPIFISFLMVLPMIWSSVESGLLNIDKKYLELARVYNLSAFKTFFEIKLPFIMPSFISTALTALGFAWKSGIAAEVICRPENSLGNMLQSAKLYISTPDVFAITAVVALLSILLEMLIGRVVRGYTNDKY